MNFLRKVNSVVYHFRNSRRESKQNLGLIECNLENVLKAVDVDKLLIFSFLFCTDFTITFFLRKLNISSFVTVISL
jgi:hypothetical protein